MVWNLRIRYNDKGCTLFFLKIKRSDLCWLYRKCAFFFAFSMLFSTYNIETRAIFWVFNVFYLKTYMRFLK